MAEPGGLDGRRGFSPARFAAFMAAAVLVAVLDQASKFLVSSSLDLGGGFAVTSFFNLCHVRNTGAAFSFLSGAGGWQLLLFGGLAAAVCIAIVAWLARDCSRTVLSTGLALVLAGATGNLIDRILLGAVVDFLDFHLGPWHWPAFNIADIAICCGAFLVVVSEFFRPGGGQRQENLK